MIRFYSFLRAPFVPNPADKLPLLPGTRICMYAFFVCAGASCYYDAPALPALAWFLGIGALAAGGFIAAKRIGRFARTAVGFGLVFCFCLGITAAALEMRLAKQDTLPVKLNATDITATVDRIKQDGNKAKLYLSAIRYDDGFEILRPAWRARLSASVSLLPKQGILPGTVIRIPRATFQPLPLPVTPGGYDFAFFMYAENVGAIGFVTSYIKVKQRVTGGVIDRLRAGAFTAITTAENGDSAASAVAGALFTGERGAIPDENVANMRHAGLAHLLAISGMHVGIVTGLCFLVFRRGLACVPPLANRYDIRRAAALLALAAAGGYVLLTGAPVSAQRAFFMTGLFLLGLTFYRRAAALQSAGLAAFCMALVMPHITMHPGFRMSFCAVIAIIAMFAHYERRKRLRGHVHIPHDGNIYARVSGALKTAVVYILSAGLSSLAATMATTPFSVYHFHQFTLHGMWTNLVAIPLTGLWIMPAGMLSLLAMPFGLEHYPLLAATAGIDYLLQLAEYAAEHEEGVYVPTSPSGPALFFWLAAVLTGFLLHGRKRFIALPCTVLAVWLYSLTPAPDVFLHENGKTFAFSAPYTMVVNDRRAGRYARERWREAAGHKTELRYTDMDPNDTISCDTKTNCIYRHPHGALVIADNQAYLDAHSPGSDIAVLLNDNLISRAPTIITKDMLAQGGTHAISFRKGETPLIKVAREICPAGCPWRADYAAPLPELITK